VPSSVRVHAHLRYVHPDLAHETQREKAGAGGVVLERESREFGCMEPGLSASHRSWAGECTTCSFKVRVANRSVQVLGPFSTPSSRISLEMASPTAPLLLGHIFNPLVRQPSRHWGIQWNPRRAKTAFLVSKGAARTVLHAVHSPARTMRVTFNAAESDADSATRRAESLLAASRTSSSTAHPAMRGAPQALAPSVRDFGRVPTAIVFQSWTNLIKIGIWWM